MKTFQQTVAPTFAFLAKYDIIIKKMLQTHTSTIALFSGPLLVSVALASLAGVHATPMADLRPEMFLEGPTGTHAMVARGAEGVPNTPLFRQAKRLQTRLGRTSYLTPS